MLRMSKLTDYSFVVLMDMAQDGGDVFHNSRDLASNTGLPVPTVSKILKVLAQRGILQAHRGVRGGYRLAVPPDNLTVGRIVEALEGPIVLTDCLKHDPDEQCCIHDGCVMRRRWEIVNEVINDALSSISLRQLMDLGQPGDGSRPRALASLEDQR